MSDSSGTLYIVGTPIGNMEDVTLRALRILREVDLVAAEDTRHTGVLLTRHQLRKPLLSYHEFNESKRTPELLAALRGGRSVALVSDAGMPTLSDPGQRLIQAALADHVRVEVVPGPSAVTAALAGSGLAAQPFLFYGFLPYKSAQRRKALATLAPLPYSLIFFESPFRLVRSLHDIREVLGDRQTVVARELTKKFEEFLRGSVSALLKSLENRTLKGEITVLVEGCTDEEKHPHA